MNMTDFEQLSYARQLYPKGITVRLIADQDAEVIHAPILAKVKVVHDDCSITVVLDSGDEMLITPGAACMERVLENEIE